MSWRRASRWPRPPDDKVRDNLHGSSLSPQRDAAPSRSGEIMFAARGLIVRTRRGPHGEDRDHRIVRRRSRVIGVRRAGSDLVARHACHAASRGEDTSRRRIRSSAPASHAGRRAIEDRLSERFRLCGAGHFRSGLHPLPTIWRRRWRRVDVISTVALPLRHMIPLLSPSKRHCCGVTVPAAATVEFQVAPRGFTVR